VNRQQRYAHDEKVAIMKQTPNPKIPHQVDEFGRKMARPEVTYLSFGE